MRKFIKILTVGTLLGVLLLTMISCEETRKHTLGDLSFEVPQNLRVTNMAGYDIYLSTMECALSVQELDDEMLAEAGLRKSDGLEKMVNDYFTKNGIDKSQCHLTYSEKQNAYKFRYSVSDDQQTYYFHYVVMIGNGESFYFVDMICDFDNSNYYLQEFERWGKTFNVK